MAWEAASRGVDLKLVSQYVLQWGEPSPDRQSYWQQPRLGTIRGIFCSGFQTGATQARRFFPEPICRMQELC